MSITTLELPLTTATLLPGTDGYYYSFYTSGIRVNDNVYSDLVTGDGVGTPCLSYSSLSNTDRPGHFYLPSGTRLSIKKESTLLFTLQESNGNLIMERGGSSYAIENDIAKGGVSFSSYYFQASNSSGYAVGTLYASGGIEIATTTYKIMVDNNEVDNGTFETTYSKTPHKLQLMSSEDSSTWTKYTPVLWSWYNNASDTSPVGSATVTASLPDHSFTDACSYGRLTASIDNGSTVAASLSSFKINPKQLTASNPTVTKSKVYDGNNDAEATVGTLSGVETGDSVGLSGTASYDNQNSSVGSNYTITVTYSLTGSDVGNYLAPVDYSESGCSITQRQLGISGTTVSDKVYDGNANASVTVGTLTNLLPEHSGRITCEATGSFSDANVTLSNGEVQNKKVTVMYSLSGVNSGNYHAPSETLQAKINPCPITIHDITMS